jgi:endonuclease YncB( thermonuclease family)
MIKPFPVLTVLTCLSVASTWPTLAAAGDEISGVARVIDADILAIGNQRIILWGIDAPERNQTCSLAGRNWGCWQAAVRKLQTLAEDRSIQCTSQAERDPLGRIFATCTTGGVDLGEAMVKSGLARAFRKQSDMYRAAEDEAKAASLGLWQKTAKYVDPWIWRLKKSRSPIR